MDIQLVLEISAIATGISAVIGYITFHKSSGLTYVTQERKEWRDAIRNIAAELEKCSYKKRRQVLVELKTRINAYGMEGQDELKDAHIWKLIQEIEECRPDQYEELKSQMEKYLSALLKYDWERSKKEVYGNAMKRLGYVFLLVAAALFTCGLALLVEDESKLHLLTISTVVEILVMIIGTVMLIEQLSVTSMIYKRGKSMCSYIVGRFAIMVFYIGAGAKIVSAVPSHTISYPCIAASVVVAIFAVGILTIEDFLELSGEAQYCRLVQDLQRDKQEIQKKQSR